MQKGKILFNASLMGYNGFKMLDREAYIKDLKVRSKESRAYSKHQAIGAEIGEVLQDIKHTALYIKLAKEGDPEGLLALAKDVAQRTGVSNKGAYFMRLAVPVRTTPKVKQIKQHHGDRK
ncbi:MAG: hypothetical protein Q7S28_03875 [bacterium]|nr:hypothetical protein [bacterium]